MEILINVIEVATTLAHADLCHIIEIQEEQDLYEDSEDGTQYKEDVQSIFNDRYDYYFETLTNLSICPQLQS